MAKTSASPVPVVCAMRFIRPMRGSSQSILVVGEDRCSYVVKMYGNPAGYRVLANELIGNELARSIGLPVQKCAFIEISHRFLEQNPEIAFEHRHGTSRPIPGLQLGTAFLGSTLEGERPIQYVGPSKVRFISNIEDFFGMYVFDIWTDHRDQRQALFVRDPKTRLLKATFIDFSHLLGGPNWERPTRTYLSLHLEQSIYRDLWSGEKVSQWITLLKRQMPRALDDVLSKIPDEWPSMDRSSLRAFLIERLRDLPGLVARNRAVYSPWFDQKRLSDESTHLRQLLAYPHHAD